MASMQPLILGILATLEVADLAAEIFEKLFLLAIEFIDPMTEPLVADLAPFVFRGTDKVVEKAQLGGRPIPSRQLNFTLPMADAHGIDSRTVAAITFTSAPPQSTSDDKREAVRTVPREGPEFRRRGGEC